jgi:flagellar motor switch/type III secretory pathway protein FliN
MTSAVQQLRIEADEPQLPASVQSAPDPLDSLPWLPFTVSLELPVVRFTVADLLRLTPGSVVETACSYTSDVPLRVNRMLVGWTEFSVIGDRLAVRITDLA